MKYFVYVHNAGTPATGQVLAWEYLKDDGGTDTTNNPTFTEIGGGWYMFDIEYGDDSGPWKTTGNVHKKHLVGVIDADSDAATGLSAGDRYKPVCITLRGLALAIMAHKSQQTISTGDVTVYKADQTTEELVYNIDASSGAAIIRTPQAGS